MNVSSYCFLGAAFLAVLMPANSRANFAGSDNFDDNSKDLARWGGDSGFGAPPGSLTEINGRIEFSSSSAVGNTYRARPWTLNLGSYVEDWEVRMDTTVLAFVDADEFNSVGIGLEIWKTSDPTFYVGVEHENTGAGRDYYSYMGFGDENLIETASSSAVPGQGAVHVTFSASTKVLQTFYDFNGPTNGYEWTPLAAFGLTGTGPTNTNWGMTAADTFTAVIFGYSLDHASPTGMVYGDNFVLIPEPTTAVLLLTGGTLLGLRRPRYYAV